jgi:hypothetical protein
MSVENLRGIQTVFSQIKYSFSITLRFKYQHKGYTAVLHVCLEWWWPFNTYISIHPGKHIYAGCYENGILWYTVSTAKFCIQW